MQDSIMRLQQYMARCGVASRRASEAIILEGRVQVNSQVVTELGTKVAPGDVVLVDGKEIHLEETKRYVLLNKPQGYVCSLADEKDRPVAADLLKETYSERLYNVGRLDMFSSGLIIFTNDGDFAARLSHPSAELEKEYIVDTSTSLPRGLAEDFMKGIRIDNVFYRCKQAVELNSHRMRIVLVEGKNREIRRVFEDRQVGIRSLMRIRIGSVGVGELQFGQFRELTAQEVKTLLSLCHNEGKKFKSASFQEY
ncbi:rRNA pseudouridine synthase [Treponema rectale]|uniref:Pseudouridine synthase n=2 Tax=Treponema rectale TaxID=744512 RepID=A0A7M1XNS1_9SPIR|nr:pseudouridine synthase [Treponema rectale]QOS41233.1 rRNA pseudouridine synthase [Treponema rectale]